MQKGMKLAISGKGGVGKTTVCAVLAQLFANDGFDVLAIDADPDTNLCSAFGIEQGPEPFIKMKELIGERTGTGKEAVGAYFKLNPKVSDLPEKFWIEANGLKLLVLGGIGRAGGGCACAEGAFLKALLSHTILQRQEVVLVDLDAGVEFMGRASVLGIDALLIVVEPGSRSIQTAVNIAKMARELGIKNIAAIINKITDADELETIKKGLENIPVIAAIGYNSAIKQADIKRKNVFDADCELVEQLKKAKIKLNKLISC